MNDDDAITVTSATQTEAEVRASLGEPPAPAPPAPAAAVAVADAPPAPELEQEADSAKTDAEVSEAARTLRRSRADTRKAKIQSEIDALTRTREHERSELERERRERAAASPPAPKAGAAPAPAPAAATPAAPSFTFPTFDDYQADHPDADYDAYTDARSDARDAWREGVKQATAAHEATTRAAAEAKQATAARVETFKTAAETFAATHADYHDVLGKVTVPQVVDAATGESTDAPVVGPFRNLLMRTGDKGPEILYFLGQHPAEAERLWAAPDLASLIEAFTEVKLKALGPSPAGAAPNLTLVPPRPSKPVTDAPAPLEAVPGGAHHTPSLQQLADESEDADVYIARRKQQMASG